MSRYLNTEMIRHMSRDELESELTALGIAIDERDIETDDEVEDDRLRDAIMTALSEEGDPDDDRGDFLRDQQKDDDLRGDR